MKYDLTHNKIIADTVTEDFVLSVDTVLVPLIENKYGIGVAVQMYEDYLAEKFTVDGRWFYPLTVIKGSIPFTQWISWGVDKKRFRGAVPYSPITGTLVDFRLEEAPTELVGRLFGRKIYGGTGNISLKLFYSSSDPLFPVGKFSQTFVDMMAEAITERISSAMAVEGLTDSVISLQLVFAPDTYMEHTSENVTYRRLKLADKTSAPRDLWVKWTRTDMKGAYSIFDTPALGTIEFEIAESVPEKIREKEYRFLLKDGDGKFRTAMGRKTLTEWRELVKRAIKRGELTRIGEVTVAEATIPSSPKAVADAPVTDAAPVNNADTVLEEKISAVLAGVNADMTYKADEGDAYEPEYKDTALEDALRKILGQSAPAEAPEKIEESAEDEDDLPWETDTATKTAEPDIQESARETVKVEEVIPTEAEELEARLRREIEAKLRLEYENAAKQRAVAESQRILDEHNRLLEENERLAKEARRLDDIRSREEAARKASEDRLRAEMEAKERAEAREKERLAEAAALAVEEKKRLEMVRAEAEARIKEAERIQREEEAKKEAERLAKENARKEEEARIAKEREATVKKTPTGSAYNFTSKRVMFFFNSDVPANIIQSMESVIRTTITENGKTKVPINIKASVQTKASVCLDFVKIPEEEEELLIKIVQALGKSRLGIVKARVE